MDSILKFQESIDTYSPVYFHFLDGLISDEGEVIDNVISTLKNI
jgi:hypothetical protein